MTRSPDELPRLSRKQLEVLRRFASLEATVEELRNTLSGVFEFSLDSSERTSSTHFQVPEPGILVTAKCVSEALEKEQAGMVTQEDLVQWATILLLNDAYELDPADEDFVAEWLNRISQGFDPT